MIEVRRLIEPMVRSVQVASFGKLVFFFASIIYSCSLSGF